MLSNLKIKDCKIQLINVEHQADQKCTVGGLLCSTAICREKSTRTVNFIKIML